MQHLAERFESRRPSDGFRRRSPAKKVHPGVNRAADEQCQQPMMFAANRSKQCAAEKNLLDERNQTSSQRRAEQLDGERGRSYFGVPASKASGQSRNGNGRHAGNSEDQPFEELFFGVGM